MDFQEKFQPQAYNPLFEDKAAMRKPPSGTVARGQRRADSELYEGRTENGEYVERIPIAVTRTVLERGQDRYNVYCTPCHGQSGKGNGIIMQGDYGYTPASSYHVDRLRQVTDGYLYDVIANGVRNMPAYAQQIPVRDRWAIVAYIRALQRSQNARPETLPESVVTRLEEATGVAVRASGDTTRTALSTTEASN
jgi:mono/diheme cytochrome c family protein